MAGTKWLDDLCQLAKDAATEAALASQKFRMFGHVFSCIDGRCGVPVYGRLPYKSHRILAAYIDDRNAPLIQRRLIHDSGRAKMRGMRQLVICETHTDCAYRKIRNLTEEEVWESFLKYCSHLRNTAMVWLRRDVATGIITVVGEQGAVDVTGFRSSVKPKESEENCEELIRTAGFIDLDIVNDLAQCLSANYEYLRTPHRFHRHMEEGVVVGTGIPGAATHFSISNRMENLHRALDIATKFIGDQNEAFVAVAISKHPEKNDKSRQYAEALQHLKNAVENILAGLGFAGRYPVCSFISTKGSGDLILAE